MAAAFTELSLASALLAVIGELGHETPTEWILSRITVERQTALFSVRMPPGIAGSRAPPPRPRSEARRLPFNGGNELH
jgi:hypothetical protein